MGALPALAPDLARPEFITFSWKWGNPTRGTGATVTWAFGTSAVASAVEARFDCSSDDINLIPFAVAAFAQYMRSAFDKWESIANIDFVETSNPSAAQILVYWDSAIADNGQNVIGITYSASNGRGSASGPFLVGFNSLRTWVVDGKSVAGPNAIGGSQFGPDFYSTAL